jgi:hypothetical protein
MRFRKIALLAATALALLAVGIYAQSRTSKPCGPTATEVFNFRERCAKQAHDEFLRSGNKENSLESFFKNHYNAAMDKCFMLIENNDVQSDPGHIWMFGSLTDAYDRQVYAMYGIRLEKQGEPFVSYCQVTLPSGEERHCKATDEFRQLISVYMGEGGLKTR